MSQAIRWLGSAATIVPLVDQRRIPILFRPLNTAPTVGPVGPGAAPAHLTPVHSGLQSPMRARSETRPHTTSGLAATSTLTDTCCCSVLMERRPYRRARGPRGFGGVPRRDSIPGGGVDLPVGAGGGGPGEAVDQRLPAGRQSPNQGPVAGQPAEGRSQGGGVARQHQQRAVP